MGGGRGGRGLLYTFYCTCFDNVSGSTVRIVCKYLYVFLFEID